MCIVDISQQFEAALKHTYADTNHTFISSNCIRIWDAIPSDSIFDILLGFMCMRNYYKRYSLETKKKHKQNNFFLAAFCCYYLFSSFKIIHLNVIVFSLCTMK